MYRPDEMAMILEQAKKYTDNQQLARIEKKVYTFDNNTEGKTIFQGGYAKISEDTPNLHDAVKIVVNTDGVNEEITDENFAVEGVTGLMAITVTSGARVLVITDESMGETGLYVTCTIESEGRESVYTSCVEIETIHPIPQEYIPPLDRLILNSTDGKQYALSVDSSGQLVTQEVTA